MTVFNKYPRKWRLRVCGFSRMDVDSAYAAMEAEEAADLLVALDACGLRGEKLAMCEGQHEGLAKQLAEKVGVPRAAWHSDFIEGQIKAARDMAELEGRASGSHASPSVQRIKDAMIAGQKKKEPQPAGHEGMPVMIPRRGKLAKTARLRSGMVVPEEVAEDKVLAALIQELEWSKAPVIEQLKSAMVYVNKVGTFGVTSTPYWWAKISGALMRLTYVLVGPSWPIDMLLYADDLEVLGPGVKGRVGAVLAYVYMAALGSPFKWKKQRGGLATEWVGITADYPSYSVGLSEKRPDWICQWIQGLLERGMVSWRESG